MPVRSPAPPKAAGTRRRRVAIAASVAAACLAACDVPTELPSTDTRWVIPSEETRFGVEQLLPSAVSVTTTGSAFVIDFDPVTFSETLGALCPACVPFDGATVPKPLFTGTFASTVDFPSQVVAVTVVSGSVAVELDNQLNFDPLRPAAGAFGEIVLTITDDADGDVLAADTIRGAATALPAGTTLTRTLALAPATLDGSLASSIRVFSPLGDPVTIDVSDFVRATVTPTNVVVSAATIDAAGTVVAFDPETIDVDLDEEQTDWVQAGSFILDVVNPFGVSADFVLTIDGPAISPITKSATIGVAPTSTVVIPFTASELRSFLDQQGVSLTGSAVIDPGSAPFVVMPGEELILTGKLDLTIRIGG